MYAINAALQDVMKPESQYAAGAGVSQGDKQGTKERDHSTGQCPHHPGHYSTAPSLATVCVVKTWDWASLRAGIRCGSWLMSSGCVLGVTWRAERLRPTSVPRVLEQSHLALS